MLTAEAGGFRRPGRRHHGLQGKLRLKYWVLGGWLVRVGNQGRVRTYQGLRAARARETTRISRQGSTRWSVMLATARICRRLRFTDARLFGWGSRVAFRAAFAVAATSPLLGDLAEAEQLDTPVGALAWEMGRTGHKRHRRR